MKFHIVCDGETLKKIAFLYGLSEEELKKENKHIRVWNNLIPGTKLKIPTIPEAVDQDVSSMEPFVEDYYPKLKINDNYPEVPVDQLPSIEEYHDVEIMSTQPENNKSAETDETIVSEEVSKPQVSLETKKPDEKPVTEDKEEETTDKPQPQPTMNPYYFVPYYLYPRYIYPNKQPYVYPVYVYPKWW